MDFIKYAILALCLLSFGLSLFILIRVYRRRRRFAKAEAHLMDNIVNTIMQLRGDTAKMFLIWFINKDFVHLVGDQFREKDTFKHLSIDDIIQQYLDETVKVEVSIR